MSNRIRTSVLETDVAVVGGGVAGSSMAAVLAQAGLGVVLVERDARFRDRVRGESIHPWGVTQIEALGLGNVIRAAGAWTLPIRQNYTRRVPSAPFRWDSIAPDLSGEWSIYHPALQNALLHHACECGARVLRPARVSQFARGREMRLEVETAGETHEVHARLVIGADGRQSAARRWVGAETVSDAVHHLIGGCLLEHVALADDTFHYAEFEGGAILLFPQGGGRARTYIIGKQPIVDSLRGPGGIAGYIALCAAVVPEGVFGDARAAGPLAFFPNADVWADRLYDDRVVLIGDAAGANDPSGGHGLSLSFRDVREVRDRLLGDPDWDVAMRDFAIRRMEYYSVLREYMRWVGLLTTDVGPEADERRARVERARHVDPTRGGFSLLLAHGPDGLNVDDTARHHFFGEDLDLAPVVGR